MDTVPNAIEHYDSEYYARQSRHGEVGALANQFKFFPYIKGTDTILDFGCGGGFLLQATTASKKIGIEVNPVAQEEAIRRGVVVYNSIGEIESDVIDVIISNHALEHVEDPMLIVREFKRVLKPGGLAVIVTPYDRPNQAFDPNDKDFHLFAWSPSNLGNLFKNGGFEVLDAREIKHRWPPKWNIIYEYCGPQIFHFVCRAYALVRRVRTQVRVVARSI